MKFSKKDNCTCCLSKQLTTFIDFGKVPLAGAFVKSFEETVLFPLSLSFCSKCSHVQVNEYIDKNYLFKDYRYASGYSMKKHFSEFSDKIVEMFGNNLCIMEIGSNDGTLLTLLNRNGNTVKGVEPSTNISQIAIENGLDIINDFFSSEVLLDNNIEQNSFDIITASNCFAHIEEIDVILKGVNFAMKLNGTFIIEVHYGPHLFETCQYDFIYHEHMYYYSLASLEALLNRHELSMYDVEFIPIHGGSIRAFVKKQKNTNLSKSKFLIDQLKIENEKGFSQLETYIAFRDKVHSEISTISSILKELKDNNCSIIAFGAAGRANAFLNYAKINSKTIEFIYDESPERVNRYIPNANIPIRIFNDADNIIFDCLFITAWNFKDQILSKCKNLKYKYLLVAFPTVKLVEL